MIKNFYKILAIIVISTTALSAQGFICAVGGGSEDYNDWSDEPYGWIVEKADSGRIVVLSYSPSTWYPNYFRWLGASECVNIIISSRANAELQSTFDAIVSAKGIFIVGGDQWKYVSYWKDTKTEEAIKQVFQSGGVIAGTSAGAMILSDFVFTAESGSAMPKQSLLNPFNSRVKIDNEFLELNHNVIFDTHFIERGRFGRLIAFVFNTYINFSENIIGVGIDDKTALCIDDGSIGTVYGTGAVTFMHIDQNTRVENGSAGYTLENLAGDKLVDGWKYDLTNRKVYEIPSSALEVDTNRILSLPRTDILLTGSDNIQSNINSSLPFWLSQVNTSNILVISDEGFVPQAIFDHLSTQSIQFDFAEINSISINDQFLANKISQATAFIVCGSNLQKISELRNVSSPVGSAFQIQIQNGIEIYFLGSAGKLASDFYTGNVDENYLAAYRGQMTTETGLNIFGDLIVQPRVFENEDYYENRVSSVEWGLMHNRKRIGLFLDLNEYAKIDNEQMTLTVNGSMPAVILDARNTTHIDSSKYVVSGGSSARQVIAMNNLKYNISNLSRTYLIEEGKFDQTTLVDDNSKLLPDEFSITGNYPNPFNPETTLSFTLPVMTKVSIKIFDILGNQIADLFNGLLNTGSHTIKFDFNKIGLRLSSGIYIYSINAEGYGTLSSKMVLLK